MNYLTKAEVLAKIGGKFVPFAFLQYIKILPTTHTSIRQIPKEFDFKLRSDKNENTCLGWIVNEAELRRLGMNECVMCDTWHTAVMCQGTVAQSQQQRSIPVNCMHIWDNFGAKRQVCGIRGPLQAYRPMSCGWSQTIETFASPILVYTDDTQQQQQFNSTNSIAEICSKCNRYKSSLMHAAGCFPLPLPGVVPQEVPKEVANAQEGARTQECTRATCPDILNGHQAGCPYYRDGN